MSLLDINNIYEKKPVNPAAGDMVFDASASTFKIYDGKQWMVLSSIISQSNKQFSVAEERPTSDGSGKEYLVDMTQEVYQYIIDELNDFRDTTISSNLSYGTISITGGGFGYTMCVTEGTLASIVLKFEG